MRAVRRVLARADPDILLLAGVDHDLHGHALTALLGTGWPHRFAAPPNRGLWRPDDGDGDGRLGEAEDREGYGAFRGAGGAAVVSRFALGDDPVDLSDTPWAALPNLLHGPDLRDDLRLSTTMHWDVPVILPGGQEVRLWAWHATPPVFDGPEDANGRRNRDEAQIWVHRLDQTEAPVIVIGVANLDINDGDGRPDALRALIDHPRLQDARPASAGGRAAADPGHRGDPGLDTADWPTDGPGNLRVDYILPDRRFRVLDAGVLWPAPGSEQDALFGGDVRAASRHRLVWLDLVLQR